VRRRLILVILVSVGLVLVLAISLWRSAPSHNIDRENVLCVEVGMTEKDVEELFGVPAGNYNRTGNVLALSSGLPEGPVKVWVGDDLGIALWFDEEGRVRAKRTAAVCQNRRESFFAMMRRKVGL
jgi:hypothetical protein